MTLIELVVGLALVALLAGLAAPQFNAAARAAAVRAATFELLAGLQQARAQSIVEARPAALCPVDRHGACAAAGVAAQAWRSVLESDGDPPIARADLPAGVLVRSSRSPLRFWPTTFAASTATLTLCDARGIAAPRAIVVSQSGRARITAAADTDCRA
jgi:type IV fimbrial biogenesis protein FimT